MSSSSRNFSRGRRSRIVAAVAGLVLGGLSAWGADAVTISASAIRGYERPLDVDGKPLPETYVFMEGLDLAGTTADGSSKQMGFDQIIRVLAVNLAKQNYFPTRDVPAANLVIRVYWGTTTVYEDPLKELSTEALNAAMQEYRNTIGAPAGALGEAGTIADAGAINQNLRESWTSQMSAAAAVDRNAALLGYQGTLERERAKPVVTTTEMSLSNELNEERYFVVLVAYDYQRLKQEKKGKPLWITRLSIRSPGNNFTEAMPALAVAGADVFGKQIDGLVRVRANVADAQVKLDDLKFLGDVKVIDDAGGKSPAAK